MEEDELLLCGKWQYMGEIPHMEKSLNRFLSMGR